MQHNKHGGADAHCGSGHSAHEMHHDPKKFLNTFFVVLIASLPLFYYSEMFGMIFPNISREVSFDVEAMMLVIGTFVYFWGGKVFILSAKSELKDKKPGMMTLIAVAITVAFFYSVYSLFVGNAEPLWFELSSLIAVMLLGHYFEMNSIVRARGALKEIASLLPDKADVVNNGFAKTVNVSDLKVGENVLVRPGGRVPADGVVIEGESFVNESLITGESVDVLKNVGSSVVGGSLNGDGSLIVRVEKIGNNTFLSGVLRLVEEAEKTKSRLQTLADRFAGLLTFVALGAGVVSFVSWIILGANFGQAVNFFVAVLIISCPHALGLAIPLVSSITTSIAVRNGFAIRNKVSFEKAKDVTMVIFDKTGTLTEGTFSINKITPMGKRSAIEVLQMSASLNAHSEHSIGRALVEGAKRDGIDLLPISRFERLPGVGVSGNVLGRKLLVGSDFIAKKEIEDFKTGNVNFFIKEGGTNIFVVEDGALIGVINMNDKLRSESRVAVDKIKKMGIKVAILSGDSEEATKGVARSLGVDTYTAHVLPHEKSKVVSKYIKSGERVLFVGDGVNDAPALAIADVGVAIGAGTNVAIESAGIILSRSDPRDIASIIDLSKKSYAKMKENLWWASGYNIFAIPVAGGLLVPFGIYLSPALSAVLMSLSTLIVAFNATSLRRA